MRTTYTFAAICALAGLLSACSSTDNTNPGGGAGAGPTGPGDATHGGVLWVSNQTLGCASCHGVHAEGGAAPNITKSAIGGIGAFTYDQFYQAVRFAKNKSGQPLCVAMLAIEPKDATDQDIKDLYAYQQAQPSVDTPAPSPSYCGNSCCTGEHK